MQGRLIAAVFSLAVAASAAPAQAAPRTLDYTAYDSWKSVTASTISDDGKYFAYDATPQDGDATLVIRDIEARRDVRAERAIQPRFAAGSRFVVAAFAPKKHDLDVARKAKKKDDDLPKPGIAIVDTASGAVTTFDRVRAIYVAKNAGPIIAYRAEPAPAASGPPAPSPSPAPAVPLGVQTPPGEPAPGATAPPRPPSPSPSPSGSPAPKADKKKDPGSVLTVRDLTTATDVTIANVTEAVISDDDSVLVYATESTKGDVDGLHVRMLTTGKTLDIRMGAGRYKNLAVARDGSTAFFLSDDATYANDLPHYAAYVADLRAAQPAAVNVADLMRGKTPSENGKPRFSKDGQRVFFGVANAPTPMPSGTPEPMRVDLWTYKDEVLQSQQKHDADATRKRTLPAVFDVAAKRTLVLGNDLAETIDTNDNPHVALAHNSHRYRAATSWLGEEYADDSLVSLIDGSRAQIVTRSPGTELSPGGKYALGWDEPSKHWFVIRTADRKRIVLAPKTVSFFDETIDTPSPASPYGTGGWLRDDRGVFIYDRYDVWLADPETGRATNITQGAGRAAHVIYSPLNLDPDKEPFDPASPLVLSLLDERTFASGFARGSVRGMKPVTLMRVDKAVNARYALGEPLHNRIVAPVSARHADRLAFSEERFDESRDWWTAGRSFNAPARLTDINPQKALYRWGTESLVDWKASDGTPRRGILYTPNGLDRSKKAPMLVYFYERFSDTFHLFRSPGPGTSPNLTRYVSNGYVVFLPDVFYEIGHPGRSAMRSIMPGIDAVLKRGIVDPKRVGIAGHSWAAYQINYMITQTDRFRAVEAGAAVTNMTSAYGGIRLESGVVREGQYEHGQSRIGAPPWTQPGLYLENSGLFHITAIHTPYLTIHNDADGAVPWQQGIEFITAMRRLHKPAYMFTFNDEDHNLRGREQQKYWTVHLDEWFDYWLKGAHRPGWFDGTDYLHRGERDVRPLYGEEP